MMTSVREGGVAPATSEHGHANDLSLARGHENWFALLVLQVSRRTLVGVSRQSPQCVQHSTVARCLVSGCRANGMATARRATHDLRGSRTGVALRSGRRKGDQLRPGGGGARRSRSVIDISRRCVQETHSYVRPCRGANAALDPSGL